jgi:hypothetical protein
MTAPAPMLVPGPMDTPPSITAKAAIDTPSETMASEAMDALGWIPDGSRHSRSRRAARAKSSFGLALSSRGFVTASLSRNWLGTIAAAALDASAAVAVSVSVAKTSEAEVAAAILDTVETSLSSMPFRSSSSRAEAISFRLIIVRGPALHLTWNECGYLE